MEQFWCLLLEDNVEGKAVQLSTNLEKEVQAEEEVILRLLSQRAQVGPMAGKAPPMVQQDKEPQLRNLEAARFILEVAEAGVLPAALPELVEPVAVALVGMDEIVQPGLEQMEPEVVAVALEAELQPLRKNPALVDQAM